MTLNNCPVVPQTARCFRAVGGGWAVKMRLAGKRKPGADPSVVREYVLGPYAEEATAQAIVATLNSAEDDANLKDADLMKEAA